MSRGKKRVVRPIASDPIYNSEMISRFINIMMLDGKKEVAQKIVYGALKNVEEELKNKFGDVKNGFNELIMLLGPTVQLKTKRIGGTNYRVPMDVPEFKRIFMGMTILKNAVRKKSGKDMITLLTNEIKDAINSKGEAFKKKEEIQRDAIANKAYSHLA